MNKGLTLERIRGISGNFHQAGIAVSWMTFFSHPGETTQEAMATLDLIDSQSGDVDQFIVGEFNIAPGSLIWGNPGQYGISSVYHAAGDVFKQFPLHIMEKTASMPDCRELANLENKLQLLSWKYHLDHYPWAGSISTHHSFLYILRFGQRVFSQPWGQADYRGRELKKSGFTLHHDITAIRKREEKFMQGYLRHALRKGKSANMAPLAFVHFQNAVREFELKLIRQEKRKGRGTSYDS
jgi:hypothetical protein